MTANDQRKLQMFGDYSDGYLAGREETTVHA